MKRPLSAQCVNLWLWRVHYTIGPHPFPPPQLRVLHQARHCGSGGQPRQHLQRGGQLGTRRHHAQRARLRRIRTGEPSVTFRTASFCITTLLRLTCIATGTVLKELQHADDRFGAEGVARVLRYRRYLPAAEPHTAAAHTPELWALPVRRTGTHPTRQRRLSHVLAARVVPSALPHAPPRTTPREQHAQQRHNSGSPTVTPITPAYCFTT